jgi:hypothetical protein
VNTNGDGEEAYNQQLSERRAGPTTHPPASLPHRARVADREKPGARVSADPVSAPAGRPVGSPFHRCSDACRRRSGRAPRRRPPAHGRYRASAGSMAPTPAGRHPAGRRARQARREARPFRGGPPATGERRAGGRRQAPPWSRASRRAAASAGRPRRS